jgi:NAD(P)-dependent dehydrogenase (short-subunit alcohol dehydrogenase family)
VRTGPVSLGERGRRVELASDSVVLVAGGARGITSAVAIELARRYSPTLILLGRSPLPTANESPGTKGLTGLRELKSALMEEYRQTGETPTTALIEAAYGRLLKEREMRTALRAMEQEGATVRYHQVDVTDPVAVGHLLNNVYQTYGRLDGVIHGAGIIEDRLVTDKTLDSYDRVFDTKVQGAFALVQHLRPESLKFLVFFSSVAGLYGNAGQADYGAANEVLNKIALALDLMWPGRVVSINWGPWAEIGMASPEVQQRFVERGVELVQPAAGQRMFALELELGAKGDVEVILGAGPWDGVHAGRVPESVTLPFLEEVSISAGSRGGLEVMRTFDPARDLYLLDHQLDSRPVVPAAVAMELMAEVGKRGWPDREVRAIKGFRVLNGIVLKNGSLPIRIMATPETQPAGEEGELAVNVVIKDPAEERTFYQAIVLLGKGPAKTSISSRPLDGLRPFPMSVQDGYERLLFHGPTLQGIAAVHGISDDRISATLLPSSPRSLLKGTTAEEWLIDPVIIDGAFQLAILWARLKSDITVLPVRYNSFLRFAPLAGSRILCNFQAQANNGDPVFEAQVSFLNPEGQLLGLLEHMEFSGSKSLNRLSERALMEYAE